MPFGMECTVSHQNDKAASRRILLDERRKLTASQRREKSLRIADNCRRIPSFEEAGIICSYVGFGEEVETADLIRSLLAAERSVAVPVLHDASADISFSTLLSWDSLEPNRFGILEPSEELCSPLPIASIPLFLIPGLAFGTDGSRLGFGMGCYDKALADRSPTALVVGLCFDLQIRKSLPNETHDVPVDMIITETRVISVPPQAGTDEEVSNRADC